MLLTEGIARRLLRSQVLIKVYFNFRPSREHGTYCVIVEAVIEMRQAHSSDTPAQVIHQRF